MSESYEAYRDWVKREIGSLPSEDCSLSNAHGRTLARDVTSLIDLPRWDASAMDGFALRGADLARDDPSAAAVGIGPPQSFRVVGEVAAGAEADPTVGPGEAVRIMTGAPMPSMTDTVIPVEQVAGPGEGGMLSEDGRWQLETIHLLGTPRPGSHVRRRGEDVRAGDTVLAAGERLGAATLAATGHSRARVTRVAKIAVLSTGSELRLAAESHARDADRSFETLVRGQIPESNSLLISGLVHDLGSSFMLGEVQSVADDPAHIRQRIADLGSTHDVVITTGGIGPGRYDAVRLALADEPAVRQTEVDLKPGRHQAAGRLRAGAFVFALPGNPGAAAVSFELVVRAALLTLVGRTRTERTRLTAVARKPLPGKPGRLRAQPVWLFSAGEARSSTSHGLECAPAPSLSSSYERSHGLALIESDRGSVEVGETVQVIETGAGS